MGSLKMLCYLSLNIWSIYLPPYLIYIYICPAIYLSIDAPFPTISAISVSKLGAILLLAPCAFVLAFLFIVVISHLGCIVVLLLLLTIVIVIMRGLCVSPARSLWGAFAGVFFFFFFLWLELFPILLLPLIFYFISPHHYFAGRTDGRTVEQNRTEQGMKEL